MGRVHFFGGSPTLVPRALYAGVIRQQNWALGDMGKIRTTFGILLLLASAGSFVRGLMVSESDFWFLVAFFGVCMFVGVWPWRTGKATSQKLDTNPSFADLPHHKSATGTQKYSRDSASSEFDPDFE